MPMLIDGQWTNDDRALWSTDGRFRRKESCFRNWIQADGSAGPTGRGGFPAAAGRYHLYVAAACPWAHRTLIVRTLKGLGSVISCSSVDALMLNEGWTFGRESSATNDPLHQSRCLYEVYQLAEPRVTTRVTVPVLWDKESQSIVSNESSEIIRMLNYEFQSLGANALDLYPETHRTAIDEVNGRVYRDVNNGVYKTGFARSQSVYEESCDALFHTLDWLEERLEGREWLVSDQMTEADIRLFVTLIRFDSVYHGHFKCNRNMVRDMPNLSSHTARICALPGVAETFDVESTRLHYYGSHKSINPSGIVPRGPLFAL